MRFGFVFVASCVLLAVTVEATQKRAITQGFDTGRGFALNP